MTNVYDILFESSGKHSERTALVYGDHRISYQQALEASDRLAAGLQQLGVAQGDRIALILPNMPHFVMSAFAILKLGATVVPLSIFAKVDESKHQLREAGVVGIVYWEGFRPQVKGILDGIPSCKYRIVLGDSAEAGEKRLTYLMESNNPLVGTIPVNPEDTAFVVFTAGTTGTPKGVELTHKNLIASVDACYTFLNLRPDDSVLGVFPLFHPLGHTLVLGSFLRAGASVVLLSRFVAETILQTMANKNVSYFVGVPSMYRALLHVEGIDDLDLGSLKFCLSGGDAMKEDTMKAFEERFKVPVLEGSEHASIGLPLPGFDLQVETGKRKSDGGVFGHVIQRTESRTQSRLHRTSASRFRLEDRR